MRVFPHLRNTRNTGRRTRARARALVKRAERASRSKGSGSARNYAAIFRTLAACARAHDKTEFLPERGADIASTHGLISPRFTRQRSLGRPTYFIASASRYTGRFSPASRPGIYTRSAGHKPSLEYPMNVYDLINALSPRCLTAYLASNRSRTHVSKRSRAAP